MKMDLRTLLCLIVRDDVPLLKSRDRTKLLLGISNLFHSNIHTRQTFWLEPTNVGQIIHVPSSTQCLY